MQTQSKKLLLVDGLGAVLSTVMHGVVLVMLHEQIGMPKYVLYPLALIAVAFAIFSLGSYFLASGKWWRNLKAIAIANLSFCLLSAVLMALYFQDLSLIGKLYFGAEILVVVILAGIELRTAARDSKS